MLSKDLSNDILKGHTGVVNLSEKESLCIIKQLAVIPVSVVVQQSDFLSTRKDLTENIRSFAAFLKEKQVHALKPVLSQKTAVIKGIEVGGQTTFFRF